MISREKRLEALQAARDALISEGAAIVIMIVVVLWVMSSPMVWSALE